MENHNHRYDEFYVLENLPMMNGSFERIRFLICDCGHSTTYPMYSLQCALGDGTEATHEILKEFGYWQ